MIKAVVFDLDDTLISEYEYIKSGYIVVSKYLQGRIGKSYRVIYDKLISLFDEDSNLVFNRCMDYFGISYSKNEILDLVNIYREHIPNISFFEDVLPLISELKNKNIKIGIITDGYRITQRNKIKVLDIEKIFDEVIVTDELGRDFWKPHLKSFEIMRARLDVEYHEMIYVGDNPKKDFYVGSIYDIQTVRIDRGGVYSKVEYFEGVKEKFTIESIYEILELLRVEAI